MQGIATRVLMHGHQAGHAVALFILTPHQATGPLGCDQHAVEIVAGLDLLEMNGKAVSEQQRRAIVNVVDYALVQALLDHIRSQKRDDRGTTNGFARTLDGQTVGFCPRPAGAIRAQSHDHVEAAVLEVKRMCAPLTPVPQYRDLLISKAGSIDVSFRIHLHGSVSSA